MLIFTKSLRTSDSEKVVTGQCIYADTEKQGMNLPARYSTVQSSVHISLCVRACVKFWCVWSNVFVLVWFVTCIFMFTCSFISTAQYMYAPHPIQHNCQQPHSTQLNNATYHVGTGHRYESHQLSLSAKAALGDFHYEGMCVCWSMYVSVSESLGMSVNWCHCQIA